MPDVSVPPPERSDPRDIRYKNFDVKIRRGPGDDYVASVPYSPAGEGEETIRFPFETENPEHQQEKVRTALGRGGTGRTLPEDRHLVQEFGTELFRTLFSGNILRLYDKSSTIVEQQGMGLRLRLRLDAPELVSLPWEYLYDPQLSDYICFSRNTPVVRYPELSQEIRTIRLDLPLRILVMAAMPSDCAQLSVQKEKDLLGTALGPLVKSGRIQLKWAEGQTWQYLQDEMRKGPWHIFHFIGHGGFDAEDNKGFIALADKDGHTDRLSADELAGFLADHKSLGLVVLNCCESARSGERDVISSTSSVLIRRGIPAVVAMQYAISDDAAIVFSKSFYESLADGYPIDAAMAEARKALRKSCKGTVEWGTPVLYLRSPDGELFDIERGDEPSPTGVVCKVCGAQNPGANQFCKNCGKSLKPDPPPTGVVCKACGAQNPGANQFCKNCGKSLKPYPPPPTLEYPRGFIYLGLLCSAGALCMVLLAFASLGNSSMYIVPFGLSGLILLGSGISLLLKSTNVANQLLILNLVLVIVTFFISSITGWVINWIFLFVMPEFLVCIFFYPLRSRHKR